MIGASPLALSVWQTLLLVEILFHHSNVRLPLSMERWINLLVVTPRMHGIHRSTVDDLRNSNFSSGLTLWDWVHRTLRLDVPQEEITIGVPGHLDPQRVTFGEIMRLPFRPNDESRVS